MREADSYLSQYKRKKDQPALSLHKSPNGNENEDNSKVDYIMRFSVYEKDKRDHRRYVLASNWAELIAGIRTKFKLVCMPCKVCRRKVTSVERQNIEYRTRDCKTKLTR